TRAVAPLLRRSARRVALDDEQLARRGVRVRAVAQLARQIHARRGRALARHLGLRGAARLARARREDDARDDRVRHARVRVQPVLQRRTDDAVDRGDELRVVQAILGLSLELRLLDEHAQDAGQPLADVFGDERDALRRQVVRLDVVAHGLAEAGAQAGLVRAARSGRNAVDVRAQMLVGRFGPLQDDVDARAVFLRERERRLVDRLRAALGDDLPQVVDEPFLVLEDDLLVRAFVLEGDLQAFVQVARDFEPLFDHRGVELDLREDRGVGMEVDLRAGAARCAGFLQRTGGLALLEAHLPQRAVALDLRDELLRERVDDARADAVQPAGRFVIPVLEFAAGVEHGKDDFERAFLRRRMFVNRNPASVVFYRDRRSIGVERHPNV